MYRYRNMFKGIAFVMILVVLLMGISHVFTPKNNVKGFGMFDVKANGILGERDGSIDVLVLGDSEAYSAFSPMQIWDEKGIPMYVCATSGQHLYEAINFFEQALKKQKPKVVILETNAIFRKFSATDTIRNKVENNLGVFRYHDRWKSMTIGNMIKKSEYTWVDDYKGFYLIKDKKASTVKNHMKYTKSKAEIPEMNYKHVLEIKKLAEENGAKLILVSTPSTKNWNYKRHNSIAKMAKDENIEYIDMNLLDLKIDWKNDTRDKGDHMNFYGAQKVSKYLANYLAENEHLKNKKEDRNYEKWNDSLKRYKIEAKI